MKERGMGVRAEWIKAIEADDVLTVEALWQRDVSGQAFRDEWFKDALSGGPSVLAWYGMHNDPSGKNHYLCMALAGAVSEKKDQKVHDLMHFYDPTSVDQDGSTALMWAAYFGLPTVIQMMLDRGANPLLSSDRTDGETALFYAIYNGNLAAIKMLIPVSNLDHVCIKGHTALMKASLSNDAEALKLLTPGSSIDAIDHGGHTALMLAAKCRVEEAVEWLMPISDWSLRNKKGQTFWDLGGDWPFLKDFREAYRLMEAEKDALSPLIASGAVRSNIKKNAL